MDGGKNADKFKAKDVIQRGLDVIREIHKIEGPFLRGWVITHWDLDHYGGLRDWLKDTDTHTMKGVKTSKVKTYFFESITIYTGSTSFNDTVKAALVR